MQVRVRQKKTSVSLWMVFSQCYWWDTLSVSLSTHTHRHTNSILTERRLRWESRWIECQYFNGVLILYKTGSSKQIPRHVVACWSVSLSLSLSIRVCLSNFWRNEKLQPSENWNSLRFKMLVHLKWNLFWWTKLCTKQQLKTHLLNDFIGLKSSHQNNWEGPLDDMFVKYLIQHDLSEINFTVSA